MLPNATNFFFVQDKDTLDPKKSHTECSIKLFGNRQQRHFGQHPVKGCVVSR